VVTNGLACRNERSESNSFFTSYGVVASDEKETGGLSWKVKTIVIFHAQLIGRSGADRCTNYHSLRSVNFEELSVQNGSSPLWVRTRYLMAWNRISRSSVDQP